MPSPETSTPCRVYAYHCRLSQEDTRRCLDGVYKAHTYRNNLVRLENERRAKVEELLRTVCPGIVAVQDAWVAAEATITAFLDGIRADRVAQWKILHGHASAPPELTEDQSGSEVAPEKRYAMTPAQKKVLASLKKERQQCYRQLKALKKQTYKDPAFVSGQKAIDKWSKAELKARRATCGVYWGTYLQIEQSCSSLRSGAPPRPHGFRQEGLLAVQFQGGATWGEITSGQDTRLDITPIDPKRMCNRPPWVLGRFRIASANGGKPVWVGFRVKLHRPIPEDGMLKWAKLVFRRVGISIKTSLQVTVARAAWSRLDLAQTGTVGIDVGWRLLPSGHLRVASWAGDDGQTGELTLPPEALSRWQKVEDLQSIRRQKFTAIVDILKAWIREHEGSLPNWFKEQVETLPLWRAERRLAKLILRWREPENRFPGDEHILETLDRPYSGDKSLTGWRPDDKHLLQWQEHQRRGNFNWRLHIYRLFAAELSRRYHTAIIENTDWRELSTAPAVDQDKQHGSKEYKNLAAVSILIDCLKKRFASVGKAPAQQTTQTCHACGTVANFDARANLSHTCAHCGLTWDQDANAARNLLARAVGVATV